MAHHDAPYTCKFIRGTNRLRNMKRVLDNPLYYLDNFHRMLDWIAERYSDLTTGEEQTFIARFKSLPQASRALLVRMVMRKGDLFRPSKLVYDEIGCTREAARPLVEMGWVDDQPALTLEQLFGLLTKSEIAQAFTHALPKAAARKSDQLEMLRDTFTGTRHFESWYPNAGECVYRLSVTALCDRLRLMFFGNLHQDWSEFVLADLGIFKYEQVEFSAASRGFQTREDVDLYLHLYHCRERFAQGEPADAVLADVLAAISDNNWLEGRRNKLLFQIAQHYERTGELDNALNAYAACSYPGSRARTMRVLERCGRHEDAYALAQAAERMPESEVEKQHLARVMQRLRRKLGQPKTAAAPLAPLTRLDLTLPKPDGDFFVEGLVCDHLTQADAPAIYVENTLINSLFGLLCWRAVFTAVPGAFFHPFHTGPADLHNADFQRRREKEFADCLSQLDSTGYRHTILRHFHEKAGIQSPFVAWEVLTEELLQLALDCISAAHLKKFFERILLDIKSNRSGLPDLIQFWPRERRYRMIEVKGPGDRLQDNQIRWLDYCVAHGIPVAVCYVQWTEDAK